MGGDRSLLHGSAFDFDPGDVLLLPDMLWGNYRLTYDVRLGARIATYPFYKGSGFNTAGFALRNWTPSIVVSNSVPSAGVAPICPESPTSTSVRSG